MSRTRSAPAARGLATGILLALVAACLAASFVPASALVRLGERVVRHGALEAVTVEALGEVPWILRGLALCGIIWLVLRPLALPAANVASGAPAPARAPIAALVGAGVALTWLVHVVVLGSGMISGDEWNNEFTALLFAHGRLWSSPPPHAEFFRFAYFVTLPDRTFSIFPPLWPALLALGKVSGIGVAMNALVAGAAAWLVATWHRAPGARLGAALVLVLSPMFVFAAASWFASPTVLACLMAELWCLRIALEASRGARAWMAGAGLAWGLLLAAHYPTAVGAGLPAVTWAITRREHGRVTFAPAIACAAGAAVPLALLGVYHHALHGGAPWLLPASFMGEAILRPEFHPITLVKGAAYTALHVSRLLAWTFPLLPLLALASRARDAVPASRLLWLSAAGLVAFYAIYPSAGGPQFGPRYYFGLLGPLAIFAGTPLARLAGTRRGLGFVALLVVGGLALFAMRARIEHERTALVNAPFRLAAAEGLTNAIVFMRNVNRADHARNAPGWSSSVLFVPDLGERDRELTRLYPERALYTYRIGERGPELGAGRP